MEDEQVMDQAFIDEVNTHPVGDRLLLLQKILTSAITICDHEEGCGHIAVVNKELFKIGLDLLNNMAHNDGKIL